MTCSFAFTDEKYAIHADAVEKQLQELRERGVDSRTLYGELIRGRVRWSAERRSQHRQLIRQLFDGPAASIPRDSHALLVCGLDGAGKTTLQNGGPDFKWDASRYLAIDPHRIAEAMAVDGMIPVVDGLSPMEASPLVQEEAFALAYRLAGKAYDAKCNVIWELELLKGGPAKARMIALQEAGYRSEGVFIDVPVDFARASAMSRHRDLENAYRNGHGLGGWIAPLAVSESCRVGAHQGTGEHPTPPATMRRLDDETAERETIREIVDQFRRGGIGFSALVSKVASRCSTCPDKVVEPADWVEVYRRAEDVPDDDDLFWVSMAEDLGTLTLEQAEEVFSGVEHSS